MTNQNPISRADALSALPSPDPATPAPGALQHPPGRFARMSRPRSAERLRVPFNPPPSIPDPCLVAAKGFDMIHRMSRLFTLALLLCPAAALAQAPFVPLFDGKTLKGWQQCNGQAKYEVAGGVIVGTTAEGSPNSFLCTSREYGDFVLEFETMTDPALNSGVQIRSHRYGAEQVTNVFDGKQTVAHKQPAGRVYGYQVEVANEKSGASGGIYDEARRGWLHNIASDPVASKAFKDNQWNKYRIEARGDHMRVWINGVPCADVTDPIDQTGFIALQVHQYKGDKPAQVRWRNIRIQDLGRHIWKPVWDGRTMDGWKPRGGGKWTIEDGAFHAVSVPGNTNAGYMVSDASFSDFTLRIKVKIIKGNSGVFVRTSPDNMAAYEIELDSEKRTGGFWETGPGARAWVTGPEDNAAYIKGEWNTLYASLHGHKIVFHLNGVKTVDLPDDAKGRLEGVIGLQCHGRMDTEVWFKDIEVLVPGRR